MYTEIVKIIEGGLVNDKEKVIKASKEIKDWKNPIWRNYDGTIAEW